MTISEYTTKNFDALTLVTKTAKEMALTSHNLSKDGKYARVSKDELYIWSDTRNCWVLI